MARKISGETPLVRSASAAATELIREAIVVGRLQPGERLKEEELAQEFGVSRTPIREALLILQAEGLIEALPQRGVAVRSYDLDHLEDLYRLRALLEGHAARRAAANISRDELADLQESSDRFEALEDADVEEFVQENLHFHNVILDACGSPRLAAFVRKVTELPLVYKSYTWYTPEQRRLSAHYHRQIVRALQARDGERAERLLKEHIFEARDVLVTHVRGLADGDD